jgi:hypothetical protein
MNLAAASFLTTSNRNKAMPGTVATVDLVNRVNKIINISR